MSSAHIITITMIELEIEDLPYDMLNEIIAKLALVDHLNLLRVSKYWYNLPSFNTNDNISVLDYHNAQQTPKVVNNVVIMRYLIKSTTPPIDSTAIAACLYGNIELMRLLIATRPKYLHNFERYYFNCFQSNNKGLADELMKLRCGYSKYNDRVINGVLLEGACAGGHTPLVRMLIIKAQINKYPIEEQTLTNSIKYAFESGNQDIIQILTRLGGLNVTANRTLTIIHIQMARGIFSGGHYDLYLSFTANSDDEQRLNFERTHIHLAFSGCHEQFIRRLLLFNQPGALLVDTLTTCACFKIALNRGCENLVQLLLPDIKIIYKAMLSTSSGKMLDGELYMFLDYAKIYGHIGIVWILNELVKKLHIHPQKPDDYY